MRKALDDERRGASRWPVAWTANLRTGILGVAAVDVLDISATGAQVRMSAHVARAVASQLSVEDWTMQLELSLRVSEQTWYPAAGHTRWHRTRDDGTVDVGLLFDTPLPADALRQATN